MPDRLIPLTAYTSEFLSTFLSFGLFATMPSTLSMIASSLAIIWWLWKLYDKVSQKFKNKKNDRTRKSDSI